MVSVLTVMEQYALKLNHENTQTVIHRTTNIVCRTLNGKVITLIIVESSHTDLEEIDLAVEMLIIQPCGRDANNHPRRDQGYGYQYSQPQRGGYRR